ncbi:putative HECT-type ubiquitin ligase-interacting protein creD [Cladobotryum mycophilum]|uniref:HECT-type ubiquitin ligase-interacting protein creD n=1 Tax=Cladobotryum mycophilum TaxID=491253 RepID=A0ABR0STS7_9HYPO
MPSFKPFSSVTGRHSYSLFDIRLDDDFIVFRGGEQESSGQLLKGVVVLCLSTPLRIEDVHLRLVGTLRLHWADGGSSTSGVSSGHKLDKTSTILDHRWAPFIGTPGKSMTLPAGNYEYPFEFTLPGETAESVEGIPEASITYRLKATVRRGKLATDLHAYKHLRIIRTLEPGALEFLHAMSVENIWPNKLEYSIVVPQKAVVFGGTINLEMRFTPLLKGLELGTITAKMMEIRECCLVGATGLNVREHRMERDVATWKFEVNRDEHWHDMIEDTGQEGWTMNKPLNLPKKLRQCVQDLNLHGIKVRHKIKLTVALRNPDGHISELRATLPVSIFISPNIPFDENGNLVNQAPGNANSENDVGTFAPPGYGEHVLDQLYDELDVSGFQTPAIHSGMTSPFYGQSRTGSSENLASIAHSAPIAPAALTSLGAAAFTTQFTPYLVERHLLEPVKGVSRHEASAAHLSRTNSEEDDSSRNSAERAQVDAAEFAELNRVPSYATAVRTPARSRAHTGAGFVPDYQTALSAPRTPPALDIMTDHLSPIAEITTGQDLTHPHSPILAHSHSDDATTLTRLHLARARDQAV